MSFRTSTAGLHRRFDLMRRSLLQAPGLPFADTLSAQQIQHAFDAEDVHFGDDDDEAIYTLAFCKDEGDGVKLGKIGPFLPWIALAQLDCGAPDHARHHRVPQAGPGCLGSLR